MFSWDAPGLGVTKASFINFSIMEMYDATKLYIKFFESHSYLTGITAAMTPVKYKQDIRKDFNYSENLGN